MKRSSLRAFAALFFFNLCLSASPLEAQTRRAFLVGINKYSDINLQKLTRSIADAEDLESELKEVDFDKKNIKRVENIKTKSEFDKEFDAFLKTVSPDDVVFFFFSGHGFGVELKSDNYLLMGDLKSPFAFTKSKLPDSEKKDGAIIRLRISSYIDDYKEQEVERAGVSVREIQRKIAARKPKAAILVLDACRTLINDDDLNSRTIERGPNSGSRLVPAEGIPPGFLILYSASYGEQAVESVHEGDRRRNSLFTEVLRQELIRPGQSAVELAKRVKLVTRDIATQYGFQQEPESFHNFSEQTEPFYLINSIGRERFEAKREICDDSLKDLDEIEKLPTRDELDRHRRRFAGCDTAEKARRLIAQMELGSDEQPDRCDGSRIDLISIMRQPRPELITRHLNRFLTNEPRKEPCPSMLAAQHISALVETPAATDEAARKCQTLFMEALQRPRRETFEAYLKDQSKCPAVEAVKAILAALPPGTNELNDPRVTSAALRRIDDCDYYAASEQDKARPPEVPGVFFAFIKTDDAIKACEKSIKENPRISRFLFNIGRAFHRKAWEFKIGDKEQLDYVRKAQAAYSDAEQRGYVSALNGLAVLTQNDTTDEKSEGTTIRFLKQAAQQNHPLAMYNLAFRYRNGDGGVHRDLKSAYELFARSAEAGYVPAMVQLAWHLRWGQGVAADPRRAEENLKRAADAGSVFAKRDLGEMYRSGGERGAQPKQVKRDPQLALLWLSRAADEGDSFARNRVAYLLAEGEGLPSPQPELAERFWRLAAHGGESQAQFEFADRLRNGSVLIRPEFGSEEAISLLERALTQGSAPAALWLAQIYRNGELGKPRDSRKAIEYAFQTIKIATQISPSRWDGSPYYEIAAGHLLAEMARNGEANDARGRPLFRDDEIERMEKFYGKPDAETKQVKVRRLEVPLRSCSLAQARTRKKGRDTTPSRAYPRRFQIWVWDWGRQISPTEAQIQLLEHVNYLCSDNQPERQTLIASFETAKRTKVPFADLIEQQIKAAALQEQLKQRAKK